MYFSVCQAAAWEEEKSGDCCVPALCHFRSSGLSNGHPERCIRGGGHKLGWVLWQDQQRDPHTLLWRTERQGWRTKGPSVFSFRWIQVLCCIETCYVAFIHILFQTELHNLPKFRISKWINHWIMLWLIVFRVNVTSFHFKCHHSLKKGQIWVLCSGLIPG